jgi:hypothetical protein
LKRLCILPLLSIAGLVGCAKQSDLMPLKLGTSATYEVSYGLEKHVEPLTISRSLPVDGVTGFELSGPMGVSRVAWHNGELRAAQTANAWFDPAIPILADDKKDRQWSGRVGVMGVKSLAKAVLTHKQDKLDMGSKAVEATLAELTITLPRGTIVVDSWFQPGVGLVRQEQRTADKLVVSMEMIGGPKSR